MPAKLLSLYQFNRGVGAVTGASLFSALVCPHMADAAEAADLEKVPVSAMVAAVASGATQTTVTYVFPLANHDGEVVGHHVHCRPIAYMTAPPKSKVVIR